MRRQAHQLSFHALWQDVPAKSEAGPDRAPVPVYRVQLVHERTEILKPVVEDVEDAAAVISEYLAHEDREHFVVLMLDAKNKVLGIHTASIGTLMAALVEPREVFKAAILANAASIVVGHNHPSGDPTPSPEDHAVTEMLREAGKLLRIEVLDHVVVGEWGRHVSIRKSGGFRP
jgi:DNA repair protein RadC